MHATTILPKNASAYILSDEKEYVDLLYAINDLQSESKDRGEITQLISNGMDLLLTLPTLDVLGTRIQEYIVKHPRNKWNKPISAYIQAHQLQCKAFERGLAWFMAESQRRNFEAKHILTSIEEVYPRLMIPHEGDRPLGVLNRFPKEIRSYLLFFFDVKTLAALQRCCTGFYSMSFDAVWIQLLKADFPIVFRTMTLSQRASYEFRTTYTSCRANKPKKPKKQPTSEWACPRCTLINSGDRCNACDYVQV